MVTYVKEIMSVTMYFLNFAFKFNWYIKSNALSFAPALYPIQILRTISKKLKLRVHPRLHSQYSNRFFRFKTMWINFKALQLFLNTPVQVFHTVVSSACHTIRKPEKGMKAKWKRNETFSSFSVLTHDHLWIFPNFWEPDECNTDEVAKPERYLILLNCFMRDFSNEIEVWTALFFDGEHFNKKNKR